MAHVDAPKIIQVQMIDNHRVEVYWDQEVTGSESETAIQFFRSNELLTVNDGSNGEWDVCPIYELVKKRSTYYIVEQIAFADLPTLTLKINSDISNKDGKLANKDIVLPVTYWEDFYSRYTMTDSMILIKSSSDVERETHRIASDIIDKMLLKHPEISKELVNQGAALAIYGSEEDVYDLPESRGGSDKMDRPVEGYGGTPSNVVTTISERNVIRKTEGQNQTRYLNECILVHEFGHAIHLIGINCIPDHKLADKFNGIYQHALDNNLWPNTYAISNYEEYFATLSTIWFNVMAESLDGSWDGVRGPINTRNELKEYDPIAYEFFKDLYSEDMLPGNWAHTPNYFEYTPK